MTELSVIFLFIASLDNHLVRNTNALLISVSALEKMCGFLKKGSKCLMAFELPALRLRDAVS